MRISFLLLFLFFSFSSFGIEIDYALKMPKPNNHYFEVTMTLNDLHGKALDVKMPVWAPGSYMVREFSKNVNQVRASDELGNQLLVAKTSKNTWNIRRNGAKTIKVSYEVYAFELSVRTSFLDASHAFVSGSSVFMYVDGEKNVGGKLDIYPYEDFSTITTSLKKSRDSIRFENAKTYTYNDFDHLVDSPIEIGNQEVFEFTASGVKHTVALYGAGNYEIAKLQKDMKKVVETATNVFKENPNQQYTFIIHNVVDGEGGLEHMNSTTLSVDRWGYQGKEYIDFLSLVAHEYFHLWNVKRLRPIELGPFNYDQENYTSLLWFMEGFTSYYDELLMRRAGYLTDIEYLNRLNSVLNYVEGSEGNKIQPVAHSSYDAWIKAYRPNENSSNTTVSYYSKGQLIAALLDAKIIAKFQGNKSLDDFMRTLYRNFYKKENRGFTEKEFEKSLTEFMHEDMEPFLQKYIYETRPLPYKDIFNSIGVKVEYTGIPKPNLGITFTKNSDTPIVKSVRSNSAAENAGINVNDEIIGFNGIRINSSSLEANIAGLKENDHFNLFISRDGILMELSCKMMNYEQPSYKLSFDNSELEKSELRIYWLRTLEVKN